MPRCLVFLAVGLVVTAMSGFVPAQDQDETEAIAAATEHLRKGRYDEAAEAFTAIAERSPDQIAATIGLSEVKCEQGQWERAEELLAAAADQHPEQADLHSRLAQLHFERGRYEAAGRAATRAIEIDPDNLRAKLIESRLQTESGKIAEAIEGFRWFVQYYNQHQPQDADDLLLVAEGAIEYARAKSVSQIFNFVVNELTPDALKAAPLCWRSHLVAGNLLLEKYNEGQAVQEFNKALAINPHAAEVLAALGRAALDNRNYQGAADLVDRALEVNPRCVPALLVAIDVALAAEEPAAAQEFVERAAAIDSSSQSVLARVAACDLEQNGIPGSGLTESFLATATAEAGNESRRYATLYRELIARNPAPGGFLTDLGEYFEQERRWDSASRCYARAIEVAPQLSRPRTSLGLLKMRTGDLEAAREILDAAFKADPYHVRVSNMRKVLGVLEAYETLQTEHFVVRFDRNDRLQAEFLAEYLEEIYPGLTKELGYEPPTRTPFEIYSATKGQSAHSWFSARMIGLPWIQTIGASTGMIVALASPTAGNEKYDWARVVKHEFSHVLTLQETGFAIPHWYTEAIAVRTEGDYFPDEWRRILKERARNDELFHLDTLNQGFQRPRNGDDWQCAYCLSRLYARYLEETFGTQSLFQLVSAYREGLKTEAAIQKVTGKPIDEFEKDFREFLTGVIAELDVGRAPEMPSLADAKLAHESAPDDVDAKADYAWAILSAAPLARAKESQKLAEEVLEKTPGHPIAQAILARLALRSRKADKARELLEGVYDSESPHFIIVSLLGRLSLDEKDYEGAADIFEAGLKRYPGERGWTRALAVANLRLDRTDRLPPLMEAVARHDPSDAPSREWLLARALSEKRWDDAVKWGVAAIHIDVMNPKTHRLLGEAYLELDQPERARTHLEAAQSLDPQDSEVKSLIHRLEKAEDSSKAPK